MADDLALACGLPSSPSLVVVLDSMAYFLSFRSETGSPACVPQGEPTLG